ncbi:hypothetical protein [Haloferax sp. Q22]|jgi:hypothetical protein|uniref:hypothetical protein n=1 Tax=Haloferax sp. (strain Q22) TaxID=1526048 RepID=UPI000737C5D0|nr:hypothetical protein [Haloferax sp. Q22]
MRALDFRIKERFVVVLSVSERRCGSAYDIDEAGLEIRQLRTANARRLASTGPVPVLLPIV